MSWDHERVEELLAAHVLGAIDEDDRVLAERALAEHVPGCARCRGSFQGFREVAGALALGTPPAAPPQMLLTRLRRRSRRSRGFAGRRMGWVAAGLAVALVGALGGWNLVLADRLNNAETHQRWMVDALGTLGNPQGGIVPLEGDVEGRVSILYAPESRRMYLVASGMRRPERGVYHVWLMSAGKVWSGGTFVPREGVVMMQVERGPATLEEIMVTHELSDDAPTPSASPVAHANLMATTPPVATPTPTPSPTASPGG